MVRKILLPLLVAISMVTMTACADGGGSAQDSVGEGDTVKVGFIWDATGPAAAGFIGGDLGAKARIDAQNAAGGIDGRKIELVVADSASTPAGALAAAKNLVEQKGVFAVMTWTYNANAAASYLEQKNIPVIGGSWDSAQQWIDAPNFFATMPANANPAKTTTYGTYFKNAGVTKAGTIGLNSASGATAAKFVGESIASAGIDTSYVNTSVAPATADFGPLAISIKNSGVDGLYIALSPDGIFGLSAALKQQNVKVKLLLAATGYGQSLLDNVAAREASDGTQFVMQMQPAELNTPQTQKMGADLKTYSNYVGDPDFAVAGGYMVADLFIYGMDLAKADLTRQNYIDTLRKNAGYNGGGLLAGTADYTKSDPAGPGLSFQNCMYVAELDGNDFKATIQEPVCGDLVQ